MVYLPEGVWYDYWSHAEYQGNQYYVVDAPLDICPIFVKEGTILPKAQPQMYVGEIENPDLILEVYPGCGSYTHYYDNGEDFAYLDGEYQEYLFRTDGTKQVEITKVHEGYRDYREIVVQY